MWDVEASSKFEEVRGGDMSVFRRSECIYNQRLSTIVSRPLKQPKRDCKNCATYTLYINYMNASAGECKCEYEFKDTFQSCSSTRCTVPGVMEVTKRT